MATKKYIVREGFVVFLALSKPTGEKYERTYTSGEEVVLEDADAALHAHKLEFASDKDRAAALAAEKAATQSAAAANDPAVLVQMLVAALAQAQGVAPAPAVPTPAPVPV
jgi:hypothetical protein